MLNLAEIAFREIRVYHYCQPFRFAFAHARATHTHSHNIIVAACLDDGTWGYGESIPREFVTGESIDSVFTAMETLNPSRIRLETCPPAVRCALELAYLDAYGKSQRLSVPQLIRPMLGKVEAPVCKRVPDASPAVSGVIGQSPALKQQLRAWVMKRFGLPSLKLKVGADPSDTLHSVKQVRRVVGKNYPLRLDANGAWSYEQAADLLQALEPFAICAVEEPLRKSDKHRLRDLKQAVSPTIILDESVGTREDLEWALREQCAHGVNLRISKCGGLVPGLQMAKRLKENGWLVQLGSHVGETGILDAAARHFLRLFPGVDLLETGYGSFLFHRSLVADPLRFGYRGKLTGEPGPYGLGLAVNPDILDRYTRRCRVIHA
ncbi:MAG: mandelate racemase/muconate lactonizing enzyme family protein [Candidatus Omnitrophota bacterium]